MRHFVKKYEYQTYEKRKKFIQNLERKIWINLHFTRLRGDLNVINKKYV